MANATTDFALDIIDGFEEYQAIQWTLAGTSPVFSSTQSYGGNVAISCATDTGTLRLNGTAQSSNVDGDPGCSILVDLLIETMPNGGVLYVVGGANGTTSTNTLCVGISSDGYITGTFPEASATNFGDVALSINTWYQLDIWANGNGDFDINVRRKDATGTLVDNIVNDSGLATSRNLFQCVVGKLEEGTPATGKIWLDNLVYGTFPGRAGTIALFDICERGTHMVGAKFPAGAGFENDLIGTPTYDSFDDWATGVATSDGSLTMSTDQPRYGAFAASATAANVGYLYALSAAYAGCRQADNMGYDILYGDGSSNYAKFSTAGNYATSNIVLRQTIGMATDVLSSNTWQLSILNTIQIVAGVVTAGASTASGVEVQALVIRYWGALTAGGGGSYGFILG